MRSHCRLCWWPLVGRLTSVKSQKADVSSATVAGPCSTSKDVDVPFAGFIPMSRLDPSRLTDMSVDAAGSEDQAQVSLDEPKRSAMVGQEIKAKIIQASHHIVAVTCSQYQQPLATLPSYAHDLHIPDKSRQE